MRLTRKTLSWVALVVLAIGIFALDLHQQLDLEALKARQGALQEWAAARPWQAAGLYFGAYVAVATLSLPGAGLMTLLGGALFGLLEGTLLVSFASALGATLAMLISRFLLRDWVRRRFARRLAAIDRGIAREGAFYLFALRLVPAFPYVVINLAMGLTQLPARTFWWVSQLGMLPGTLVLVNAGRELAELESLGGILSPGLIGAFAALGLLPLLSRWALGRFKARRVYANWSRPRRFDRNLVVVGAGSGGLVAAYLAASAGAKVSLIEKHAMGGECLNTGCVPSKTLIRSAAAAHTLRHAARFGLTEVQGEVDFPAVMQRIERVIARIAPHDSAERYRALGVDVVAGHARITSPWTVEVDGRALTTRAIIIATGSQPRVPEVPGLELVTPLTSDTVWSLRERPGRLLVIGGGPIGCELAQAFQRLGSAVTLVQRNERLLTKEDRDASERVADSLRADGVRLLLAHDTQRFEHGDGGLRLVCRAKDSGYETVVAFDQVLFALGRAGHTQGLIDPALALELDAKGNLVTDAHLATRFPNILAVGDVTGRQQFTHVASRQAWYAAMNGLFGSFKRFKVDERVIPWATFTDPEVARVGLSEAEADAQGIAYETTVFDLKELDRAITDEAATGFVKVLTVPGKDRILGATIVAEHAAELITEYVAAMKHGYGLRKILGTIHIYPTLSEANKAVAGQWRRAHLPRWLMLLSKRLNHWRLGRAA